MLIFCGPIGLFSVNLKKKYLVLLLLFVCSYLRPCRCVVACILEGERHAHFITLRYTRNVFIHRAVIGGAPAARVYGTDTRIAVCGGGRLDSWGHGMGATSATATSRRTVSCLSYGLLHMLPPLFTRPPV